MKQEAGTGIPPAVVVHAGRRDGYHLAQALAEAALLEALVTDAYWPGDIAFVNGTIGRLVGGAFINKRFDANLPRHSVVIAPHALLASALSRASHRRTAYLMLDRALSIRAKHEAVRRRRPLFAYSYYAYHAFRPGPHRLAARFLFQLHPHPAAVRAILRDELERTPAARQSLMMEHELMMPERRFRELCAEPALANGWVVASSYTASTLAAHGVPPGRIHVVPYGVDHTRFSPREQPAQHSSTLTALFIGSMIQRKGLSDLLDAARLVGPRHVRLVLCGRGLIDRQLLARYADLDLHVHIGLPDDRLVTLMHESDIFVFPSLAEGFGHVILEAMATGLPVITTDHTAGADVMNDGEHGFIIPIRSPEVIADRLAWSIAHRAELEEMGQAAAARARRFTWDRFHLGIVNAYREMYRSITDPLDSSHDGLPPAGSPAAAADKRARNR